MNFFLFLMYMVPFGISNISLPNKSYILSLFIVLGSISSIAVGGDVLGEHQCLDDLMLRPDGGLTTV